MKRFLAFFIFLPSMITICLAQDNPVCDPDTAFVNSDAIVDPLPYVNDTLGEGLPDACINTPYSQTIFVHPPAMFNTGVIIVPVNSFRIDSVINLPEGISYTCSTEDCLFKADSVSCIYLSGIPTAENSEEVYELKIFITINAGIAFQATFPDPALAPGEYNIAMHPEGDPACGTVPVLDIEPTPEWISLYPNPIGDFLNVEISGERAPVSNIRIWDQSGLLVKELPVDGLSGLQQFYLGELPAGFYISTIQTKEKVYRSKIIKS